MEENIVVQTDEVDEVDEGPASGESRPPPPPPKQPPPPAPMQPAQANDSLSLSELRSIVKNFKTEPVYAYAYSHEDTRTFAEELEEWFQYTQDERAGLQDMRAAFEAEVRRGPMAAINATWMMRPAPQRQFLWSNLKAKIGDLKPQTSLKALQALAYVTLGCWYTAAVGFDDPDEVELSDFEPPNQSFERSYPLIDAIRKNAFDLIQRGALNVVFTEIQRACNGQQASEIQSQSDPEADELAWYSSLEKRVEVLLTILYVFVEVGRWEVSRRHEQTIRDAFISLQPNFLGFLAEQISRIRWMDTHEIPLTRTILLFWKTMLLVLGNSNELQESKETLSPGLRHLKTAGQHSALTTNPLDYHVFRQEIISKYPSYNPPPSLLPLEPDNTSYLPPVPRSARSSSVTNMNVEPAKVSKSIFEQPVHITTPVPSPPPSPAGPGGKGGKKQNYQTRQDFPFLYPPMDSSSNDLGGKGGVALQDRLVGKRWEGGDVPTSIREAGELFASRMTVARWVKQLWNVREACERYDRGWDVPDGRSPLVDYEDLPEFDIDSELLDELQEDKRPAENLAQADHANVPKETEDPIVQRRLDMLDELYRSMLPRLQSIVIVLLKVLLSNISPGPGPGGSNSGSPNLSQNPFDDHFEVSQLPKANLNLAKSLNPNANGVQSQDEGDVEKQLEILNTTRTREITSKGISGLLLVLLKWFRFSHILKFEFVAELLLDSNYLPLALKYFAMQDVDRAVDRRTDSESLGFFRFCQREAGMPDPRVPSGPPRPPSPESSEDDAQPPPIRRAKTPSPASSPSGSPRSSPSPQRKPEVDELGYPTNPPPQQPLTTYSARFFFTTISMLRILQKITKHHAHRSLLLVQYKSSAILRKALKIPQPALRQYTLKLFKSQVPYCGRKWRQANMKVITAIYTNCRMELRDDWISGSSAVDEWVEGALDQEKAWRGLVGWWHTKNYRDCVGIGKSAQDEEDFFTRELEKMGWGPRGMEAVEDDNDEQKGQDWEPGQAENW